MKIKCLIVDDEKPARDLLKQYCNEIFFLEVRGECKNAYETMDRLTNEKIDLLFLDIKMPKLTGLQLLRSLNNPPFVIITTAYREYAFEGFELEVLDYLKKPFSFERFLKSVLKVKKLYEQRITAEASEETNLSNNPEFLFVKTDKIFYKIVPGQLMYVEAMGDYAHFYTKTEKYVIYITMKKVEQILPSDQFIRVHRSFVVALRHIDYVEGNIIHIGDKEVPIGKSFRDDFKKRLM
jgi:DNA-binding LytR/AlgR family response regulator